ncbi:hypothetical protein P7D22_04695 [Lichenihabitans sp. Uapishka_5]|uniref:hypothetical protein n=1 Tax=Lichenihabitans sp. Uapishka_5 TaxID=3037302 RepID=UPI0029E7F08E|nr:hypothetical protein [Lichenihabitans sp. Uapishka_5]MDX7950477.1 hypothetical protein [Lichenihabitans sp. Uapishka_5]
MPMRFASAALAVGMISSGGVSHALASPFSITIGAGTGADGGLSVTLAGDTLSSSGRLQFSETEQTNDLIDFISTSFTDTSANFTRSDYTSGPGFLGTTNSAVFTVFDPTFNYSVADMNGPSVDRTGYSFSFTLYQYIASTDYAPPGTIVGYDSSSVGTTVLGSVYDTQSQTTTATGNPLSPVPLPASAPLFGAALLGLGALSYGMKRRSLPRAA